MGVWGSMSAQRLELWFHFLSGRALSEKGHSSGMAPFTESSHGPESLYTSPGQSLGRERGPAQRGHTGPLFAKKSALTSGSGPSARQGRTLGCSLFLLVGWGWGGGAGCF